MINRIKGIGYSQCAKIEAKLEKTADLSITWMTASETDDIKLRSFRVDISCKNLISNDLISSLK